MATVTLSPKFQVVVPQDVRDSMRLKPGQKFQVFHEDGQILFVPVVPMKQARGFARGIDTTCFATRETACERGRFQCLAGVLRRKQ